MRGAPLRIGLHANQTDLSSDAVGGQPGGLEKWTTAVTKLIPGEVVAAYLAGRSMMQGAQPPMSIGWWIGWTIFCLLAVFALRRWMTSDAANGVPAEWSAVVTAMLSFLVWVYSFGDVFEMLHWWNKIGSALVLIGWTLISPVVLFLLKKVLPD